MTERNFDRFGFTRIALMSAFAICGASGLASAGIIATDSYQIGVGAYTAGTALKSDGAVGAANGAVGFGSNGYTSGSGTSNFIVNSGGLSPNDSATAGNVSYSGYGGDTAIRSVARNLASTPASASTYWFGINVSQDGSSTTPTTAGATTGYALAGFGNTTPPTLGNTTTSGLSSGSPAELQGLFFGFAHESGDPTGANADLVIRYRNGTDTSADTVLVNGTQAGMAYTIIASLTVNVGGSTDYLSYWVNPTNTSSIAAMDASSLTYSDYTNGGGVATLAFQTPADFTRLTYSAQNWNGDSTSASFGDPTLANSLADVSYLQYSSAVPEPSSVVMLGMGIVGGLGVALRRHRKNLA